MVETVQERQTTLQEIRTAVRHSAIYSVGNVSVKILGFLMLPFYTHYLGPGDYGLLEILDVSISLLGMILHMGIAPALLRSYAAAESAEEKQSAISTAFLFVGGTGLIILFLGLGLVRPVSALIFGSAVPSKYLLLSFCSFILSYIAGPVRVYLRALESSGTLVLLDSVGTLLVLGLNIFFIAALKIGLLGILLSPIIVNIAWIGLFGKVFHRVGIRFSAPLLKEMVSFGLPLIFSNLAVFVLNFADRFFLKHFRSLEVVGLYAVGYKFAFMINFMLVQPFFVMWQSRMYAIQSQPQHAKIFGQIFILYSLMLTYAALALAILSPEIVGIMAGPKFAAAGTVIPVVALAYVVWGIGYYLQTGMYLAGRTHLVGAISAVSAAICLVVNYVLIQHFGMLGGAWATLISFLTLAASSYWFSQRVFPMALGVGRVVWAILTGIGLYLLSRWWTPVPLGLALITKIAILAGFPVLLWQFRVISPADIGALISTRDKTLERFPRIFRRILGRINIDDC